MKKFLHTVIQSQTLCGASIGSRNERLYIIWKALKTFSRTKRLMILKMLQHRRLKFYNVYMDDDPGLTLTHFKARSPCVAIKLVSHWDVTISRLVRDKGLR